MGDETNYYTTLGVHPDASADDIRRARNAAMHRSHPDVQGGSKEATARAAVINAAFAVVGNPTLRDGYDRSLGLKAQPARLASTLGAVPFADLDPTGTLVEYDPVELSDTCRKLASDNRPISRTEIRRLVDRLVAGRERAEWLSRPRPALTAGTRTTALRPSARDVPTDSTDRGDGQDTVLDGARAEAELLRVGLLVVARSVKDLILPKFAVDEAVRRGVMAVLDSLARISSSRMLWYARLACQVEGVITELSLEFDPYLWAEVRTHHSRNHDRDRPPKNCQECRLVVTQIGNDIRGFGAQAALRGTARANLVVDAIRRANGLDNGPQRPGHWARGGRSLHTALVAERNRLEARGQQLPWPEDVIKQVLKVMSQHLVARHPSMATARGPMPCSQVASKVGLSESDVHDIVEWTTRLAEGNKPLTAALDLHIFSKVLGSQRVGAPPEPSTANDDDQQQALYPGGGILDEMIDTVVGHFLEQVADSASPVAASSARQHLVAALNGYLRIELDQQNLPSEVRKAISGAAVLVQLEVNRYRLVELAARLLAPVATAEIQVVLANIRVDPAFGKLVASLDDLRPLKRLTADARGRWWANLASDVVHALRRGPRRDLK